MGRMVRRLLGAAIAVFAIYLVAFVNVDVPDRPAGSVCGAGPVRVLLLGPTRNLDLLSSGECRRAAGFIALFCLAIAALGVALLVGWAPASPRVRSDPDADVILTPTWSRRTMAVVTPLLGLILLGLLTVTTGYRPLLAALVLVALLGWQGHRLTARPRIVVGPDALHVHGTSRTITVPFADIVRVSTTARLGVRLHRRRGRPVLLPLAANNGPYQRAVATRLRALIGQTDEGAPARPEPVDTTVPAYEYLLLFLTAFVLVALVLVS